MRSRRVLLSAFAASALVLGTVACGASGSAPSAPASTTSSKPAEQAKPAIAPTSVPKPATTSGGAAKPAATAAPASGAAAKPADAVSARPAAESEGRTSAAAPAPAAPAAAARPAPPAPAAQPGAIVPPPQPTPAKPADASAVTPFQAGRMVIFTTELSMLVISPSQLVNSLSDVVQQAGGYVAGVENKDEGGIPVTIVRLKFPPGQYDTTMRQIRGLAVEVTSEKATTQDVTEEFSDVQTQLASLEASHAKLLELMGRAQNVDEILKIQEKLAQTKLQIDRLKGRETFLQRSAEFATVTVSARPAEDVLARTYSTLRTTLRRSEAQRAQTLTAIQRAKTPEEEATLRDRLGEIMLEIERLTARIADVENKARTASVTLPTPPQEDPAISAATDQDLLKEYFRLVGERRAAEADRDRLTREQRQNPTPEMGQLLQQALLRVSTLDTQTKAIEERARRASVTLPTLTADQIAALAGLPPESRLEAAPYIFGAVGVLIVGGLGLFIGRRLRRRPPTAPTPTAPTAAGPTPTAPSPTPAA